MSITIDVESELGLCLATTLFIEYCSESILPKEVDRLQLIHNIEKIYHDTKYRTKLLKKHLQ